MAKITFKGNPVATIGELPKVGSAAPAFTLTKNDLSPIAAGRAPRELLPLVSATNQVMARLAHLLEYQKRFVRDTAHQLRTPLAVLRTQLQSAQRGDVGKRDALQHQPGNVSLGGGETPVAELRVDRLGQPFEQPSAALAPVARGQRYKPHLVPQPLGVAVKCGDPHDQRGDDPIKGQPHGIRGRGQKR